MKRAVAMLALRTAIVAVATTGKATAMAVTTTAVTTLTTTAVTATAVIPPTAGTVSLTAAAPLALPTSNVHVLPLAAPPPVGIDQRPGAALPLDVALVEADGRAVRLGDLFADGRAVVVVFAWYRCTNLCETVVQGALEALAESGAAARSVRVVAIGIEPTETPADARASLDRDLVFARLAYARVARPGSHDVTVPEMHALTGSAAPVARIAEAAGFRFARDADGAPIHPAGFLVATADGRVSRWFLGVRHDAAALRDAVVVAQGNDIGGIVDRLILMCSHLDRLSGRGSDAVLWSLRALGIVVAGGLALWIWRHRRAGAAAPR